MSILTWPRFVIEGKLPTLNDYTNSNRTHWGAGAADKLNATRKVALACKDVEIPEDKVIILHYQWYVSTKHDYDNIAFAQKFVQDGLVHAGKIPDDSPKHIIGFTHDFYRIDKGKDKVIIIIEYFNR
jgi:hypothetical protein